MTNVIFFDLFIFYKLRESLQRSKSLVVTVLHNFENKLYDLHVAEIYVAEFY